MELCIEHLHSIVTTAPEVGHCVQRVLPNVAMSNPSLCVGAGRVVAVRTVTEDQSPATCKNVCARS